MRINADANRRLLPHYMLTVASIEAKLGHKTEALQWLGKFAATGLNFDLPKTTS
ncbi:MAG TPA: hypothetical protein VIK39_13765 [Candidatus Angelobacter sp.]